MASGEGQSVGLVDRESDEPSVWKDGPPSCDDQALMSRRASRNAAIDAIQVEFGPQYGFHQSQSRRFQDEIEELAARKKEALMRGKEQGRWREEIQRSIEQEIDRRVRDALETPPLERIRRNKHRAQLKQLQKEKVVQEQRKRLSLLSTSSNDAPILPSLQFPYPWRGISSSKYYEMPGTGPRFDNRNKQQPGLHRQQLSREGSHYHQHDRLLNNIESKPKSSPTLESLLEGTPVILDENNNHCHKVDDELDQSILDVKKRAHHRYTRAGFKAALKKGKLKLKKLGGGRFMDRNGIVLTADGPFWPPECGPLYPKQVHISGVPREMEPLSTDVHQVSMTVENQKTRQFMDWEGMQVLYDAERISKGSVPHTTPDRCCQGLTFESRFESGNLRQARRVGQFEYDLVLKTDLYTSRHTQWFYFRVQRMLPGVTYKFNIINLLKKDSLYNHGMRPLFYSNNLASSAGVGWHRSGHHITYCRNYNLNRNPLLRPEISYYTLSWQMEFPEENDVCYLTHCYPFTFTDLCDHLDSLCADPERSKHVRREVMCESRAGNSCFLLTVGNFGANPSSKMKKGVVVTARVHPGETNASWMMKGFLDFITSVDPIANKLRKAFTFKIVPMLNPDGVIVGNYRCSLSGRDLNRTYRNPKKESFPTIWHTKNMLQEFAQETEVIAYCDLHGHSRKHNIFVYGCDQQGKEADAAAFLCQRLFPWLISKKAPDKFSFSGCKFQVRRCKESTGRVVMWRQMGISNSFTMEATFCGSKNTQSGNRHFNTLDFQDMGRHFCEALLEYHRVQEDKSLHSEFILELTRVITQQVLVRRGLLPRDFNLYTRNLLAEPLGEVIDGGTAQKVDAPERSSKPLECGDASTGKTKNGTKPANLKVEKLQHHRVGTKAKDAKGQLNSHIRSRLEALQFFDSMDSQTIQECISLIGELQAVTDLEDSDTSGSDSNSESEVPAEESEGGKQKRGKREKRRKKHPRNGKKAVSAQGDLGEDSKSSKSVKKQTATATGRIVLKKHMPFVNRYQHRSNNGIPMFAEERTQERASKRLSALQKLERERREREADQLFRDEDYMRLVALTHRLHEQKTEVSYKLSPSRLGVEHSESDDKASPTGADFSYPASEQVLANDVSPRRKQHPVTRSRQVYTSDGQSSSDLDVFGTATLVHQNEALVDFEMPPMYQVPSGKPSNTSSNNHRYPTWEGACMNFDSFQGVEFTSDRHMDPSGSSRNGKAAGSQKRAQSSMAFATVPSNFQLRAQDNIPSSGQVFTNRQSELMKQKSAPSELRRSPKMPVRLSLMHHNYPPTDEWRPSKPTADDFFMG